MKIIGLAGRAGSGKSAVARALAAAAADTVWIELDRVAWETYAPGAESYAAVVERFGEGVLNEDGSIDRGELAVRAFVEAGAREDLEAIVHPAVLARMMGLAEEERERGTEILLVEGALLSSSPHVDRSVFDAILWFEVSDDVREARLRASGRADHVVRGDDVSPGASAIVIDAVGSIEDVVGRVRRVIDKI
jgi:dephospho-CoA kinase